jgi:hypothetical protein
MKPGHSRPVKPHKDTEETKSLDEQIEKTVPVITLTTPTPRSSKSGSGSSSTVKASQVNPPKKVVDKIINEQITGPSNTHAKTEEHELNSTSKPKAPKESTKSDSSSDSGLWMKGSKRTKGGQVKKAPDEKMI